MKKRNPYKYKMEQLKNFREFETSDIMARNIITLVELKGGSRQAHNILQAKIRKMFVFGYTKALYDIDKKGNKRLIQDLFDKAEQLDYKLVRELI